MEWLVEELASRQLDVDQTDPAGNTPLHSAAKRGHVSTIQILLNHGAQVALKNALGLRPFDCARLAGKHDCAEFLLLYEVSVQMSYDLLDANLQREQSVSDLSDLNGYFK